MNHQTLSTILIILIPHLLCKNNADNVSTTCAISLLCLIFLFREDEPLQNAYTPFIS